jgi:hypothetical protein
MMNDFYLMIEDSLCLFVLFCVFQQAKALTNHTDLKVGMYWGDMGVDYWDGDMWKSEMEKHEVRVRSLNFYRN